MPLTSPPVSACKRIIDLGVSLSVVLYTPSPDGGRLYITYSSHRCVATILLTIRPLDSNAIFSVVGEAIRASLLIGGGCLAPDSCMLWLISRIPGYALTMGCPQEAGDEVGATVG